MNIRVKTQIQIIQIIMIGISYNYFSDDFKVNAFKFSVKSYLSNVFESLLDESLYYLEKER